MLMKMAIANNRRAIILMYILDDLTMVIFHMCVQVVTSAGFVITKLALKGLHFAVSSLIVHGQLVLVGQNFGAFLTADFQVFSISSSFFICHLANFLVLPNFSHFHPTV